MQQQPGVCPFPTLEYASNFTGVSSPLALSRLPSEEHRKAGHQQEFIQIVDQYSKCFSSLVTLVILVTRRAPRAVCVLVAPDPAMQRGVH